MPLLPLPPRHALLAARTVLTRLPVSLVRARPCRQLAAPRLHRAMSADTLNQTMLRVKDPEKSVAFYEKYFGMTLIQRRDFSDFSLYFMVTLPNGDKAPTPGSDEANAYLHGGSYGVTLELTHNHGTEKDEAFSYHNGNTDPRGFGHIGFLVDDVYAHSDKMLGDGIPFKKKPDDGSMKGLAFAIDPDGYWVEILKRTPGARRAGRPSFQQSMLRVRSLDESRAFYEKNFGMTTVQILDFPEMKFSLAFLATLTEEEKAKVPALKTQEATDYLFGVPYATLELTFNYGTDTDPDFAGYDNKNVEANRGFGHIAFMVEDVYKKCEGLEAAGVKFQKKPDDGRMKGLAFALDPDGYWVEIVRRGGRVAK